MYNTWIPLNFYKLHGTGNDFLFVDFTPSQNQEVWAKSFSSRKDFVKQICDRHFGLGADGFVFVEKAEDKNLLKWDFYNSDGSSAEMCGNAARCMALFCVETGLSPKKFPFLSQAGQLQVEYHSSQKIAVTMTAVQPPQWNQSIEFEKQKYAYHFINSGVPHAVFFVDDKNQFSSLRPLAQFVRSHPRFSPQGTNVTFVQKVSDQEIHSISFERGVEDYTLACGTGAVASAFALLEKNPQTDVVLVHIPGGDLTIKVSQNPPIQIGPAQWVGQLQMYKEPKE